MRPTQRSHKPLTDRVGWEAEDRLEKRKLKETYTEVYVNAFKAQVEGYPPSTYDLL
jgi:hypothetical protein